MATKTKWRTTDLNGNKLPPGLRIRDRGDGSPGRIYIRIAVRGGPQKDVRTDHLETDKHGIQRASAQYWHMRETADAGRTHEAQARVQAAQPGVSHLPTTVAGALAAHLLDWAGATR